MNPNLVRTGLMLGLTGVGGFVFLRNTFKSTNNASTIKGATSDLSNGR